MIFKNIVNTYLIVYILNQEQAASSGKRSKKKKRNQTDSNVVVEFQSLITSALPASLKKLCKWGINGFKDGRTICFEIEGPVFGYIRKTYLLDVDVQRLAMMAELTANCIVVYMR